MNRIEIYDNFFSKEDHKKMVKENTSDNDSISSSILGIKRSGHIFDSKYEDAQGYLVPSINKRPKYSEVNVDRDNEDSYYQVGDIVNLSEAVYDSAESKYCLATGTNNIDKSQYSLAS